MDRGVTIKRTSKRGLFSGVIHAWFRIVGTLSILFCLFAIWLTSIQPWINTRNSDNWVKTPCAIQVSEVNVDSTSDILAYRLDLEFEYTFDEQVYVSDRFDFTNGPSESRCRQIAKSHPVGKEGFCFVNPDHPSLAVIERHWDFSFKRLALILAFIGFVVVLMKASRRNWEHGDSLDVD